MARYDNNLVVIGGGSAGLIAAYIAATVKARVTLIEQRQLWRRQPRLRAP